MKERIRILYENAYSFKKNWKSNYRFHGGVLSIIRCFWGTIDSLAHPTRSNSLQDQLDILTFSIVPSLTLVWLAFIRKVQIKKQCQIFIGDCSGGIRLRSKWLEGVNILPFLNQTHGEKLDTFFARVCQAEYVLVCDDDVFFLDEVPLVWGLAQMKADPNVAVVSFLPRQRFTWEINQKEYIVMGSYCLLVRRDIWLKEKLSFRTVHQPSINPKSYKGEYDTADYANVELIRRGYRILILPTELRSHLHICHGISGTLFDALSFFGRNFADRIRFFRPLDITYSNLSFAKEISVLAESIYPDAAKNSFEWEFLIQQTLQILNERLSPDEVRHLDDQIDRDIQNLSLAIFDKTKIRSGK